MQKQKVGTGTFFNFEGHSGVVDCWPLNFKSILNPPHLISINFKYAFPFFYRGGLGGR